MRLLARPVCSLPLLFSLAATLSACSGSPERSCMDDAECGRQLAAGATAISAGEPSTPDASAAPAVTLNPEQETPFETPEVSAPPAVIEPSEPSSPSAEVAAPSAAHPLDSDAPSAPPPPSSNRKVDLLLMVDNSISMTDKQALLSRSASDFVGQLVNPPCVDALGNRAPAASPSVACPAGQAREFLPVQDINVVVISSSLGDVGANVACPGGERDDRAHSIATLPRGQGHGTSSAGVLEFRPGDDIAELGTHLQGLLDSVGQGGCGWEMSLESWYRFIVDPAPEQGLERVVCPGSASTGANCVQPATNADGSVRLDSALLEQRAAFLRPDSLLGIVMLSDENDCSLQRGPQSWVAVAINDTRPMFRGSSICETNPNDACCYTCPLGPPQGCDADPICDADPAAGAPQNRLPPSQDGTNLRCFDQKRRFGLDFLYPTQRYVNALSQRELCLDALDLSTDGCPPGSSVPNPLLSGGRDPKSVFLGGIVGVPWQEIASDESAEGRPLAAGELRFKSPSELDDAAWTALVGASSASPPIAPGSPFMREATGARAGVTAANPINGREYDTAPSFAPDTPDDLQYACIFPLPEPRDCSALDPALGLACDCVEGDNDRPLCEQTPGASAPETTQYFAKAYPGLRQLEVLRGHGDNAAVGSICARNVSNPANSDFGYRPAMSALLERMQPRLALPEAP